MIKKAIVSGVTGQDGAYLSNFLLEKGYEVHGIKRRSSSFNTHRIDCFYKDLHESDINFYLHYGDLTDSTNLIRLVNEIQPDEIYNLGAQSHVKVSFDTPEYTSNVDGLGATRLLEAIRILKLEEKTKFYQASTSELYGKVQEIPQNEKTSFYPRSPYAVAKLYAYWSTVNYREAYGIKTYNGILFNHESPLRGETFVTRKITRAAARIKLGIDEKLYLGNLDSKRDWGHAHDFVRGIWSIMQQDEPGDFVLATGKCYTVRDFVGWAFEAADIPIDFVGSGLEEKAYCKKTGRCLVEVDPNYFRPTEVDLLLGDASKAKDLLKWSPEISAYDLCKEMVEADIYQAEIKVGKRDILSKSLANVIFKEAKSPFFQTPENLY